MTSGAMSVFDVAERRLCTGCGACAYVDPTRVRMVDTLRQGRRPAPVPGTPVNGTSSEAVAACPGVDQSHEFDRAAPELVGELLQSWGPVLEMWEGHATDPKTRFRA